MEVNEKTKIAWICCSLSKNQAQEFIKDLYGYFKIEEKQIEVLETFDEKTKADLFVITSDDEDEIVEIISQLKEQRFIIFNPVKILNKTYIHQKLEEDNIPSSFYLIISPHQSLIPADLIMGIKKI